MVLCACVLPVYCQYYRLILPIYCHKIYCHFYPGFRWFSNFVLGFFPQRDDLKWLFSQNLIWPQILPQNFAFLATELFLLTRKASLEMKLALFFLLYTRFLDVRWFWTSTFLFSPSTLNPLQVAKRLRDVSVWMVEWPGAKRGTFLTMKNLTRHIHTHPSYPK